MTSQQIATSKEPWQWHETFGQIERSLSWQLTRANELKSSSSSGSELDSLSLCKTTQVILMWHGFKHQPALANQERSSMPRRVLRPAHSKAGAQPRLTSRAAHLLKRSTKVNLDSAPSTYEHEAVAALTSGQAKACSYSKVGDNDCTSFFSASIPLSVRYTSWNMHVIFARCNAMLWRLCRAGGGATPALTPGRRRIIQMKDRKNRP